MEQSRKEHRLSLFAMLLSIILPGLGQVYLRRARMGLIFLFGVLTGFGIVYLNSWPVQSWRDLTNFREAKDILESQKTKEGIKLNPQKLKEALENIEDKPHQELLKIKDKQLMLRPKWWFKVTGLTQFVLFWLLSIADALMGQQGFNRRAFRKKLSDFTKNIIPRKKISRNLLLHLVFKLSKLFQYRFYLCLDPFELVTADLPPR